MEIVIRKGKPEDLGAFVDLLEEVWQTMPNKAWFYLDSRETFQAQMEQGIMELWLAMDGDRVAGVFDLLIAGLDSVNYGYELALSGDQLMKTVNVDCVAVHPDYQGLGLQRRLMRAAEEWLGQGRERILLCTIHPENRYSLQNALACGYRIEKQIPIYNSVRYLLRKNIPETEK